MLNKCTFIANIYNQPSLSLLQTTQYLKINFHINYLQHDRTSSQICRLEDHKYLLWCSSAKMHIRVFIVIWQGSDLTRSSQEHHSKVTGTFLPSFMSGKPVMHPLQGVTGEHKPNVSHMLSVFRYNLLMCLDATLIQKDLWSFYWHNKVQRRELMHI